MDAQLNLARLRYMRGDADFARTLAAAAAASPADVMLQALLARVLVGAGRYESAECGLRAAMQRNGPAPELQLLLSQVLRETDRLKEAEAHAMDAATAAPASAAVVENLVSVLLSRGRPEDAQRFARAQRAREPLAQNWLAYEATAARLLNQPRYQELFDYQRFVRCYDLEPPRGWSSMTALNAALAETLAARHAFDTHPLDQSLRHGSQTTRNLVTDPDPVVQAVLAAFAEPLGLYVDEMGRDADHPFLARNRGSAAIKAGWSVQLHRGGFHVNHYHNQGWISSAYYVAVPDEVNDPTLKSGWLKFGEPGVRVPECGPEHFVKPAEGMLVLFPSYMWHGTVPFTTDESRLTIAFDAVPK